MFSPTGMVTLCLKSLIFFLQELEFQKSPSPEKGESQEEEEGKREGSPLIFLP